MCAGIDLAEGAVVSRKSFSKKKGIGLKGEKGDEAKEEEEER